jgi:hypothetical protein
MDDPSALTILFLAANPARSSQSRLEQEARDISEGLLRARHRDSFKFEQRWAVRPRDIRLALLECNPQIVHFAGHRKQDKTLGSQEPIVQEPENFIETAIDPEEGLAFQDDTGQISPIPANALADLFELFSEHVRCVLLNGCYTENLAKVIANAKHIPYVIGMNRSISNRAALAFSLGFYDAIGSGRSIKFAYDLGCTAIRMEGVPGHLTPILYQKSESNFIPPQGETKIPHSKRRVQEKCEDLEEEYEQIRQKLKWLKKEWTIKTDSEAKYELSQRIEQYEAQLQNIDDLLEQLEK